MHTDSELVRRARQGHGDALDELVRRHHGAVYRLARTLLGDGDRADDATQDCFLKAFRALDGFREEASFRTWLLAIARNEALGRLRAGAGRTEVPLPGSEDPHPGAGLSTRPDPVGRIQVARDAARARELLAELPEKQRLSVSLRIFEGLSFREVGEVIGSSEGSARVNYHHGITRLRERLNDD